MDASFITKINAIILSHYKIDPDSLDDHQWVKYFNAYKFTQENETLRFKNVLQNTLVEILNEVYG